MSAVEATPAAAVPVVEDKPVETTVEATPAAAEAPAVSILSHLALFWS
jgi:hypothetical protein